jgi:hypothetical protein
MGFEIDFKEFNLGDVLQFLTHVKKTGVLKIQGKINGEVYVKDGLVMHATDGSQKGMEALFNLSFVELEKGTFEPGVMSSEHTISMEIGKLAEGIEKRRIEFETIKQNLPPMDAVFAKSPKELDSAVALRRTDWQVLALIDGKRKLSDVIALSKLGGYEATKVITWLKEQGLIYEPEEAGRIMSGLTHYLEVFFKDFGKNGLVLLKRWRELNSTNTQIIQALNIDEAQLKVTPRVPLKPETIGEFFKNFEDFLCNEGPEIYGKLLFKRKFENFKQKVKPFY